MKRHWCWERLKAGGEGWDGWMASLTQWTWVWVNSRSWWWTRRPGMLQSMGSQRVGHDWATKQQSDDGWDWPRFYHHVLSFPHSILLYFLKSFLNIIGMFKCFCFFFFTRFENFRIFFRLHSWWWLFKNFENTYFHLHYIHTHIHIHTNICIQSH